MNVIEIEGVSKRFQLGVQSTDLRERFGRLFTRDKEPQEKPPEFWALQDISCVVEQGESFGIIGHNGSGKSTLLKLISGIYKPTKGRIKTTGRISALIEVGAGFHPDLTGRENVYLNGSVLGMKKREIDSRFDEIVAFAELEKFIDTPVKRYSTGMYMRLGFAVAAHVDPEIVLVDEVLAVGDESFQKKCMKKMHSLRREGKTIVFISHGMDAIAALCQKVMLLSHGEMLAMGEPADVITAYRTSLEKEKLERAWAAVATREEAEFPADREQATAPARIVEQKEIEILDVRLLDKHGRPCETITLGDSLRLECRYRANVPVQNPAFGVSIARADGLYVCGVNTKFDNMAVTPVYGEGEFGITYNDLNLLQGAYSFTVATFREDDTHHPLDIRSSAAIFTVTSKTLNHGLVALPHTWHIAPSIAVTRTISSGPPMLPSEALVHSQSLQTPSCVGEAACDAA